MKLKMNEHTSNFGIGVAVVTGLVLVFGGFSSCMKTSFQENTKQMEIRERITINEAFKRKEFLEAKVMLLREDETLTDEQAQEQIDKFVEEGW